MNTENDYCKYMMNITELHTDNKDESTMLAQKMNKETIVDVIKYKNEVFETFTELKIRKILLEFEFYNMKIETTNDNFEKVIEICENILNRYTYYAGGCRLEDKNWVKYIKGDKKYELKDNEIIFENSIPSIYKDDYETDKFLKQLNKLFGSISEKIKSDCLLIECERMNIHWIIFVIKKI